MVSSSTYTTHRSEAANTARAASRIICPTDKLEKMEFRTIGHYPGGTLTLNQRFCGYEECSQPGTIIEDYDYASRRLTGTILTYISLHRTCHDSIFPVTENLSNGGVSVDSDATRLPSQATGN